MKRSTHWIALLGLIGLIIFNTGCTKDPGHSFEIDMFFDLDIPAGLNTVDSHFFIMEDLPTFYEAFRDGANFTDDDVVSIFSGRGRFSTRISGIDLSFINGIGIHILDPDDHTIRKEAFYIDFVPLGSKEDIDIIPSIVNLTEYLKSPTVDVEFRIDFRTFIPSVVDSRVEMNFLVFTEE